ncbi:uncharacterized protein LOC128249859 [Octopus bimaculoides]|uniref:uncharacterized protein LOC128249859 n=1 Tax=Octopus bimaculoides TaxID=37653 RepID=UPI0022E377C3|nr:uncharacterized protein LOC128249859 [Octopus bimaculoides]
MPRKSCSLFISFLLFGIALTEFCTDRASKYCRWTNKMFPYARNDEEYCNRVRMWIKCFKGVSDYCILLFETVMKLMCEKNDELNFGPLDRSKRIKRKTSVLKSSIRYPLRMPWTN